MLPLLDKTNDQCVNFYSTPQAKSISTMEVNAIAGTMHSLTPQSMCVPERSGLLIDHGVNKENVEPTIAERIKQTRISATKMYSSSMPPPRHKHMPSPSVRRSQRNHVQTLAPLKRKHPSEISDEPEATRPGPHGQQVTSKQPRLLQTMQPPEVKRSRLSRQQPAAKQSNARQMVQLPEAKRLRSSRQNSIPKHSSPLEVWQPPEAKRLRSPRTQQTPKQFIALHQGERGAEDRDADASSDLSSVLDPDFIAISPGAPRTHLVLKPASASKVLQPPEPKRLQWSRQEPKQFSSLHQHERVTEDGIAEPLSDMSVVPNSNVIAVSPRALRTTTPIEGLNFTHTSKPESVHSLVEDERFVEQVMTYLKVQGKLKTVNDRRRQAKRLGQLLDLAQPPAASEALFLTGEEAAKKLKPNTFFPGVIITEGQQTLPLQTSTEFLNEYYDDTAEVWIQDPSVRLSRNAPSVRQITIGQLKERLFHPDPKPKIPWNCLELAAHVEDGLRPAFLNNEDCRLLTKLKLPKLKRQSGPSQLRARLERSREVGAASPRGSAHGTASRQPWIQYLHHREPRHHGLRLALQSHSHRARTLAHKPGDFHKWSMALRRSPTGADNLLPRRDGALRLPSSVCGRYAGIRRACAALFADCAVGQDDAGGEERAGDYE